MFNSILYGSIRDPPSIGSICFFARCNACSPPVFKPTEIGELYAEQLQRHGLIVTNKVNTSKLKDHLLENFPDLTAVHHGRHVLLTFRENLGIALDQIKQNSCSSHYILTVR